MAPVMQFKCSLLTTFFLSVLGSYAGSTTMVSVCGDPGMKLPPKILLEGWNFCNRAGRACSVAPRWADCIGPDGNERVTPADNAAGLPLNQQGQAECDSFTEEKERTLGTLCEDTVGNSTSYFWTAMFKSGAMNISERGRLCGLWCANKTPDCNAAAVDYSGVAATEVAPWTDTNYIMRQPRVLQEWTVSDGSGGWSGSFYGTLDETANLTALPTPSQLIDESLGPKRPGSSLSGIWFGQGDARLIINVAQESEDINFNASCTWAPGSAGLPAPWMNQTGTIDGQNRIAFHVSGHLDTGFALGGGSVGQSADLVCWSPLSWWCRNTACVSDGNASALCAQVPNISSYFGMEWVTRGDRRIHRHVLRTGNDLTWLMLYTGPEAGKGLKGGYEWNGRGQYSIIPQSTTYNSSSWNPSWGKMPTNNFQVIQWTNITLWPGGPGFYFLNMGGCWKDTGIECDGDITTDVTRYLLFQIPSPPGGDETQVKAMRCGPDSEEQRALCPPFHRYRNGTIVEITDTARFPFRAYHSVSTRVRDADGAFHCKHDCWSNPCDQDWVRLEPSPEWAEYGFPDTVAAAMSPNKWTMDVGAVTGLTSSLFSGITPPILEWTTLNMGPEMQGSPGAIAIWEVAESDVLIEEGSQGRTLD